MKPRNKHNLSYTEATTFDPGELVPVGLQEVEPGSSIQHKTDAVIRCLPMLAPIMHEVEIIITHAFIPHRIVWDDFNDFITGGDDGLDTSTFPTIDFSGSPVAKGDLAHYLGLPVGYNLTASALPFRAYASFWNTFICDEELQTQLTIDTTSGADTTTSTTLKNVNWARDRFTGSNANEYLGSTISLPLGTSAPIHTDAIYGSNSYVDVYDGNGNRRSLDSDATGVFVDSSQHASTELLYTDLSSATASTINQLREAVALQKFAEMRQIYGSTYEKLLKHDFNVNPQDQRLQQPELIARGRGMLQFSEVLATAETGTSVDVGDMKGHGIAAVRSNKYRKFFPEYGYLLSMVAIRPKPMYSQGVDRHWIKSTKEDFFNPHLQNMGMQEIQNKEVKYNHSTPAGTFGYEPIYNEYRKNANKVKGEFTQSTLNYWHMGRDLSGDPALNSSFITCSPTNRVFAQSVTNNILGMFRHKMVKRSMVKKSVKPVGLI
jgi:hypothetical protein